MWHVFVKQLHIGEVLQWIVCERLRDFYAPEHSERVHEALTLEGFISMECQIFRHVGELHGVLEDLAQSSLNAQAAGFGVLRLDAAHVDDIGIPGDRVPFILESVTVNPGINQAEDMGVWVPALALVGDLVGAHSALYSGPFRPAFALVGVSTFLRQGLHGLADMGKSFPQVVTVHHGQRHQHRDQVRVFLHGLLNLRQVLLDHLRAAADGTERAQEMLLAGDRTHEAGLLNRVVIVKDQLTGTVADIVVKLLELRSFG